MKGLPGYQEIMSAQTTEKERKINFRNFIKSRLPDVYHEAPSIRSKIIQRYEGISSKLKLEKNRMMKLKNIL
jgi:hypothetical protein